MDDAKGKVEYPAMGVSIRAQYAAGREAVFQLHFPMDVTAEGISSMLDKINGIVDRDEAFYAQDQARRQLEVEERALENMARRLSEVESNIRLKATIEGKRNPKLSSQDEAQKKQAFDTLEEGKRRVAECKAHLADLIKRAGNRDGASSPANS